MKKLVGNVTIEERDEIKRLFERKNGLLELVKILSPENGKLYERLVQDITENTRDSQKWWDDMSLKYQWEKTPNSNWEIAFESCDIFLISDEDSK